MASTKANVNKSISYADLKPGHVYRFVGLDQNDSLVLFCSEGKTRRDPNSTFRGRLFYSDIFLVLQVYDQNLNAGPGVFLDSWDVEILTIKGRFFMSFDVDFCPPSDEMSQIFTEI